MEKLNWKSIKKDFREDFKSIETKLFYITIILVIVSWIFPKLLFFVTQKEIYWIRVVTLALFIIVDIFYNLRKKENSNFFTSGGSWFSISILIAMEVLYLTLSSPSIKLKILSILTFIFVLLSILFINGFVLLVKSRKSLWIILPYFALVSATITFFGFAFTFSPINYSDGSLVQSAWDYIYFSSSTFYTSTYGDITPTGTLSKFLSQFEVFISFLIHVIVIGYLLSKPEKLNENGRKRERNKKN